MEKYDHNTIEQKWQKRWTEQNLYQTPAKVTRAKCFVLPQLPYPSGSGLHVGHAEVYTACDIYTRFQRMRGKDVLQALGWDSFGLPAENYAIKTKVHPKISTEKAIANFKKQIQSLGISVDWEREVSSHQPEYYKWTQWLFLLLFKRGLAYRKERAVNWCPSCKTVLANEQVVKEEAVAVCERCETRVIQKSMPQWFFKITSYADRLIDDLDKVDWPVESIKRQRDWIGRSRGALVQFPLCCPAPQSFSPKYVEVFTTRPDTFFGVTFLVLAPDSAFVQQNLSLFPNHTKIKAYCDQVRFKTELERQVDRSKTGEDTGLRVLNPFNSETIPVYVSDFVLGSVGTGAVAGVPGSDERDFEFAQSKGLPIIRVVKTNQGAGPITTLAEVETTQGVAVNSGFLNDLPTPQAIEKAIEYLEAEKTGRREVTYKLRDWSVSRQRFWGSPIPIVYDPEGTPHPVAEEDLPVILPEDVNFLPTGESPLKTSTAFQLGVASKYGQGWTREVDTLDTFVCSSWYYYRYLDPTNSKHFASREALETWLPVDFYIGGPEHVNGHLLYARFITKVLFDAGLVPVDEPFALHRHQGTILGSDNRIMSKRYDNVVNPTEVIAEYGADTLRMYEMFLGPLEAAKPWSTEGIKGVRRFVERVYRLSGHDFPPGDEVSDQTRQVVYTITPLLEHYRYNVVIAKLMELLNVYEKTLPNETSWLIFLRLLAPFAPHLSEELWSKYYPHSIHQEAWPTVEKVVAPKVTIPVQINGKLKGTLQVEPTLASNSQGLTKLAQELVQHKLTKPPKRTVVVPGKLVNFVVEQ